MSLHVEIFNTTPYEDQKLGTSGLRKKVTIVQQPNYLENFIQSIFDALPPEERIGCTLLVSGDGRYYNRFGIQLICEMAAANGYARILIAQGGLITTPAASAVIRERENGVCSGGIILTASHNPGGPKNDFGIKYNTSNGGPALEVLTDRIYEFTRKIKEYKKTKLPKIDIDTIGVQNLIPGQFKIEVIDIAEDWMKLMKSIFDFGMIQNLINRKDFKFAYDGLHGSAGPYAKRIFINEFGAPASCLYNCEPKEDFGGGHPDPNLTYAKNLVKLMHPLTPNEVTADTPDFGAAGDGDCDRNMILGKGFFVTPSDSVALIASYATKCIPYFKNGLSGLSRSMPTSCALDNVAKKLKIDMYETPTGWKFFGSLMDAGKVSICGEESFGTGSDHIREKDGLWAVLAWLSIIAYRNRDTSKPLVTVQQIVEEFWNEFGRNYYSRYDYEEIDSAEAKKMMDGLMELGQDINAISRKRPKVGELLKKYTIAKVDNFTYTDPVDGSISKNQGIRYLLSDGSRMVWRLSGTGSVGATIRVYLEKYSKGTNLHMKTEDALKDISYLALQLCQIEEITGRTHPTVIT